LDITTAGIVGIAYCCYGFGHCTVLMLAVLTDGRWKLAATYCDDFVKNSPGYSWCPKNSGSEQL